MSRLTQRLGIGSSVIGVLSTRGLSIAIAILSLPLYMRFFSDASVLGVWFTLLAGLGWLLTLDFGVGNGLRNRVTEHVAQGGPQLRAVISSTYVIATAIAIALGAIGLPTVLLVEWNDVFNLSRQALSPEALRHGLVVALTAVLLQLVLRNAQALGFAIHRATLASSPALATSALMLAAVLLLPSGSSAENFIALSWVYLFASNIPFVALSLVLFRSAPLRGLSPRWRFASQRSATEVGGVGVAFFAMNVCYMAIITTDAALIAAVTGPSDVVLYQVYFRPFGLISSLFIVAMSPTWSGIRAKWVVGESGWVWSLVRRMMLAGSAASLLCFLLIPGLQPLIDLWLGMQTIQVDYLHALAFAALTVAAIWNSILANVASGMGETRIQLTTYAIGAFAKVPLAIWLCSTMNSYIGVVLATAAVLAGYSVVQAFWLRTQFSGSPHHELECLSGTEVVAIECDLPRGERQGEEGPPSR